MQFDFSEQIKHKTNQELTQIFISPKEYDPEFVRLAELELNARNVDLGISTQRKNFAAKRDAVQQIKERPGTPLYIFICFISALLGGLMGIIAGYIYSQSKTKTAGGEEFYVYNAETRKLGNLMMIIGTAVFIFFLFQRLNR